MAARGAEYGPDSPNRPRLLPMPADIANRGMGLDLQPRARAVRSVDNTALMISGCMSHQTSADAWINNKYGGAGTFAFIRSLERHGYDVDYKTVVEEMNDFMAKSGFTQRPELNGEPKLFDRKVLNGKKAEGVADTEPFDEEPVTPTPAPEVVVDPNLDLTGYAGGEEDSDKKDKIKIIAVVAVVAAIVAFAIFGGGF